MADTGIDEYAVWQEKAFELLYAVSDFTNLPVYVSDSPELAEDHIIVHFNPMKEEMKSLYAIGGMIRAQLKIGSYHDQKPFPETLPPWWTGYEIHLKIQQALCALSVKIKVTSVELDSAPEADLIGFTTIFQEEL